MITGKQLASIIFILVQMFFAASWAAERLVFAVDLVRHGDRTPFNEIPKDPYEWKEGLGQLTKEGEKQAFDLGVKLRKKYIEQYQLLPASYDENLIYVRSSDTERTIESAESLLLGMYPSNNKTLSDEDKTIHIVSKQGDNLLVVKPYNSILADIQIYLNKQKSWRDHTIAIKPKLHYWSEVTGLPINSAQELDNLADNLITRLAHHIPMPHGLSTRDVEDILDLNEAMMTEKYRMRDVSLPTGRKFLNNVVNHMYQVVQGKSTLKYILFVAHDSTIMSVMTTLGVPLYELPKYAADLNFSLYENENNYYVKLTYNDVAIHLPHCPDDACALSQFYGFISKLK